MNGKGDTSYLWLMRLVVIVIATLIAGITIGWSSWVSCAALENREKVLENREKIVKNEIRYLYIEKILDEHTELLRDISKGLSRP